MSAARSGAPTAIGGRPAVARRRRKKAAAGAHDNEERWLLTYADMITLLLVLFVVLFAMSTPSTPKFLAFRAGLTAAFNPSAISKNGGNGVLDQTTLQSVMSNNSSVSPLSGDAQQKRDDMAHLAAALEKALTAKKLQGAANVTQTTRGVVVQILADKVFFASDSASLGSVGGTIVDTIAGVVRTYPNNIEVDGYTDNQPIYGGPFTSNWELSSVRAANVVDRLNTVDGLSAGQLSSTGYGANNPVATNSTPAGRLENRRIDVVILGK